MAENKLTARLPIEENSTDSGKKMTERAARLAALQSRNYLGPAKRVEELIDEATKQVVEEENKGNRG